ncbi:MAG: hypothetical protein IJI14_20705 [Anaerolineaceae bacterium]|nr:hypothetical protein [Anaerolineaceae bacterium]
MAVMTYLYRDASNFKQINAVYLDGDLPTEEEKQIIKEALDMGEYFIPEQFNLPIERPGEINEDDHCWCEFDPFTGFLEDDEAERVLGSSFWIQESFFSVDDIVSKFREIADGKDCWHEADYAVYFDEEYDD